MSRDAMVYTKEMLLEPAPEQRRTPVAPVDPFDVVDQAAELPRAPAVTYEIVFWAATALAVALGARRRPVGQPVPLGALADRQPGVAGHLLPAAFGRLPGRGAGRCLRRRGDDHVPVRDRLPGRPRRRTDARHDPGGSSPRPSSPAAPSWPRCWSPSLSHSFGKSASVPVTFGSPAFVGQLCFSPLPARLRGDVGAAAGRRRRRRPARRAAAARCARPAPRSRSLREPAPQVELPLQAYVMEAETDFPVQHVPAPDEEEAHT